MESFEIGTCKFLIVSAYGGCRLFIDSASINMALCLGCSQPVSISIGYYKQIIVQVLVPIHL